MLFLSSNEISLSVSSYSFKKIIHLFIIIYQKKVKPNIKHVEKTLIIVYTKNV